MASLSWDELRKQAEASGSGFEVIPAGTYNVVVKKATAKISQAGNDQVMVQFEIVDGPNKGYSGLFDYLTVSQAAAGVLIGKLTALGVAIPGGGDVDTQVLARDLVGATAIADVVQDEYNGTTRNKVKGLKASTTTATTSTGTAGFPF